MGLTRSPPRRGRLHPHVKLEAHPSMPHTCGACIVISELTLTPFRVWHACGVLVMWIRSLQRGGTSTHSFGGLHHTRGRSRWLALVLMDAPELSNTCGARKCLDGSLPGSAPERVGPPPGRTYRLKKLTTRGHVDTLVWWASRRARPLPLVGTCPDRPHPPGRAPPPGARRPQVKSRLMV